MSRLPDPDSCHPAPASSVEERFRLLSATVPVGLFQADGSGHVTYANARMVQLFGATEGEVVGFGWMARVHPETRFALIEV